MTDPCAPTDTSTAPDACGRRRFLEVCTLAAAAVGLPARAAEKMAERAASSARPSLVWLHFQECTGCSESLLRTSAPDVAELILSLVSLDYHETLMAAAGAQAEKTLREATARGGYICIVEGAVPTADPAFCRIGDRSALEILREVASRAAAVVAIGSCASFGGIPAAEPNPTGAKGIPDLLPGKKVVTLPGCPANPYNLLGTALQLATFGSLPALDDLGRPLFAYGRVIHEDCPRRPHYDAGRFARKYGDEGHRLGYCLYPLGCKGPRTHANCSLLPFAEVPGAWPIGIGHPCVGCTERELAFRVPLHTTVEPERPTGPAGYPAVVTERGVISPAATGLVGALVGAAVAGGYAASRRISAEEKEEKGKEG